MKLIDSVFAEINPLKKVTERKKQQIRDLHLVSTKKDDINSPA